MQKLLAVLAGLVVQKKPVQALVVLEPARRRFPGNADLAYVTGHAYLDSGRHGAGRTTEARTAFAAARKDAQTPGLARIAETSSGP